MDKPKSIIDFFSQMLSRREYLIPLISAQYQFPNHYYGLTSAALLEDLFVDAAINFKNQEHHGLQLERPERTNEENITTDAKGEKGWDYKYEGQNYSHKVGSKVQSIALLWDATYQLPEDGTYSYPSPIVMVLSNYKNKNANLVLSDMDFIPNGGIELLNRIIAKDGEETVEMIHSYSDYETRKTWMSKTQTDEFNYHVVYTVNYLSQPTFHYSSTNQKGHYGKPKVIWSNGRISSIGNYVDTNGEYALTQFAYAIVDEVENLENIKKALDSKKFKNLMELCAVGQLTVNHKVVAKFKKDFQKRLLEGIY